MTSQRLPSRLQAAVTSLSAEEGTQNRFRVKIAKEWTTQHSVLGGFLNALMISAAQRYVAVKLGDGRCPDAVHVFVQFLRRVPPGEVVVTCDALRVSSRQCVVRVELSPGVQPAAGNGSAPSDGLPATTVGIVTLADFSKELGLSQESKPAICTPPSPPSRDTDCATIDDPVVDATPVTSKLHWVAPRSPSGLWGHRLGGHHREVWVSFRDGSMINDLFHLALLSDLPLQPAATHQADFYLHYALSTLCLSVEFKKRPDPSTRWVMIRSNAQRVANGRSDVSVQILDEAGDILALSNHVLYISELPQMTKKAKM